MFLVLVKTSIEPSIKDNRSGSQFELMLRSLQDVITDIINYMHLVLCIIEALIEFLSAFIIYLLQCCRKYITARIADLM